jgi:hypothetical protein
LRVPELTAFAKSSNPNKTIDGTIGATRAHGGDVIARDCAENALQCSPHWLIATSR